MNDLKWIILGIPIIFICWQPGCCYNGAIHREYDEMGNLRRQDEIGQLQLLYFSDKRNLDLKLDGVADLQVGRSTQYPDPNTARAVAEGAIGAAIGGGM